MLNLEDRIKWITHQGAEILFIDFSHIDNSPDMLEVLNAGILLIDKSDGNIMHLGDYNSAFTSAIFVTALMKKGYSVARKVVRSATYGSDSVTAMIANTFYTVTGVQGRFVGTREEALAFLIEI